MRKRTASRVAPSFPTVDKTEEEWRQQLTPDEFEVLRRAGTERAFTGEYWDCHQDGIYRCAGCGAELFSSATKFDSGTGWPSFWDAADPAAVSMHRDSSLFMARTEVRCRKCDGHLGHVFQDGPRPTRARFCINSCALRLDSDSGDLAGERALDAECAVGAESAVEAERTAEG